MAWQINDSDVKESVVLDFFWVVLMILAKVFHVSLFQSLYILFDPNSMVVDTFRQFCLDFKNFVMCDTFLHPDWMWSRGDNSDTANDDINFIHWISLLSWQFNSNLLHLSFQLDLSKKLVYSWNLCATEIQFVLEMLWTLERSLIKHQSWSSW